MHLARLRGALHPARISGAFTGCRRHRAAARSCTSPPGFLLGARKRAALNGTRARGEATRIEAAGSWPNLLNGTSGNERLNQQRRRGGDWTTAGAIAVAILPRAKR